MTHDHFICIHKQIEEEAFALMKRKRHDYAREEDGDVLSNFKKSAEELGITPFQACGVHIYKQVAAILRYCKSATLKDESTRSRILDLRNYMDLLAALVEDCGEPKSQGVAEGVSGGVCFRGVGSSTKCI